MQISTSLLIEKRFGVIIQAVVGVAWLLRRNLSAEHWVDGRARSQVGLMTAIEVR